MSLFTHMTNYHKMSKVLENIQNIATIAVIAIYVLCLINNLLFFACYKQRGG